MIDQQKSGVYEFSGYRIDEQDRLLKRNGEVISLPPKAIELLLVLVKSEGRVLTKDELMETVWAGTFVEETNLTHNISLLRRVLDEKGSGRKFIETIPRRGYRFVAEVREAGEDDLELIAVERTDRRIIVEEERETAPETAIERRPQRPSGAAVAPFLIAALLLAAGAGYWYYRSRGTSAAPVLHFADSRRITSEGNAKMVSVSPDGKFVAFVTDRDRQHTLWVQNISTGSKVAILSDQKSPIKSVRFGPSERVYFVLADALYHVPMLGGPMQKVLDVAAGAANQSFTFSPDGKRVAFMRAKGDATESPIIVADIDGTNETLLASSASPNLFLRSPDWSPDGERIAMVSLSDAQQISLISVADGSVSVLPEMKWVTIEQVEWMPSGDALLALVNEGEIWRVDYPSGEAVKLSDSVSRYSSISVSGDGRRLAAAKQEYDGHVWLMTVGNESSAIQLTQGVDKLDGGYGLDWISEDRIRYEAGQTAESWTIDLNSRAVAKLTNSPVAMSALSPDKQFIVGQANDENGPGLFRVRIADGDRRRLAPGAAVFPRLSPDGKWVFYTLYTDVISIWRVPFEGGEPVRLTSLPGYALNPVVSPDGSRIAFVWWESASTETLPKIAVVSSADGSLITAISAPLQWEGEAGRSKEVVEWSADGQAIEYVDLRGGVSNIWKQPLDGTAPTQVTFFQTGRIANFAFSPDRNRLALSRGNFSSDIFLIGTVD